MRSWRATFATTSLAAAVAALLVLFGTQSRSAFAQTPAPGLDFSIGVDADGDGTDDCSTSGGPTTCHLPVGAFAVTVYLNRLPDGIESYVGFDIRIDYFGVLSQDNPDVDVWPDCDLPARFFGYTFLAFACAASIHAPSTYLGKIATTGFRCEASGTVSLVHGFGKTDLVTDLVHSFSESDGAETIDVLCGDPPVPPPPPDMHGDADCDGSITSLDALAILQFAARLTASLPCIRNADAGKTGEINSIDAYYCLQFTAGIIEAMPAPF